MTQCSTPRAGPAPPQLFAVPDSAIAPTSLPLPLRPFDAATFCGALTDWFKVEQRDLPWRRPENVFDPYRVLVAEVMLQQTTVAAVGPYYERFLQRFPDVAALAAVSLDEVLPLWAGLGYYSRARNLHAMAGEVMTLHGGNFPRDLAAVLALPGVGRYTAGAVTSIAFDAPNPIVDANVARLFARLFLIEGDLKKAANQQRLWSEATRLVESCLSHRAGFGAADGPRPAQLNPALMELGALLCTPRTPQCGVCPVQSFCAAHAAGRQHELPHKSPKPTVVEQHDCCVLLVRRGSAGEPQVTMRQRPHGPGVWWRGMWELPRATAQAGEDTRSATVRLFRDELGLSAAGCPQLSLWRSIRHTVTHHRITLDCYSLGQSSASGQQLEPKGCRWVAVAEIGALALPSPMRRLVQGLAAPGPAACWDAI